jgi:hypothetical protein
MSTDSNSINKETGLKKFLLDPKSGVNSVRSYLSDTIAPEQNHEQHLKSGPATLNWNQSQFAENSGHLGPNMNNGQAPFSQTFGTPRPTSATSYRPDQTIQQPQQNQNYHGYNVKPEEKSTTSKLGSFVANILDFPSQPEPSQPISPAMAPTPVHPVGQFMPPFPQEQAPYPAPAHSVLYPSTNSLAQHFAGASIGGGSGDLGHNQHQNNQGQSLAPPPEDINSATGPVPAPRLYHRMILEFETLKNIFYAARIRESSLQTKRLTQLTNIQNRITTT